MESKDVFTYDLNIRRPEARQLLIIRPITNCSDVVGQCVEPDLGHVRLVERKRNTPRERLTADRKVLQALLDERGLRLRWVLRTHQHDQLQPMEFARLRQLGAPMVQGETRDGVQGVRHGEVLELGQERVQVWATPGHTEHCLSYLWRDRVFCGGLLAVDACPHQPRPTPNRSTSSGTVS